MTGRRSGTESSSASICCAVGAVGWAGLQLGDSLVDGAAAGAEFFDALRGERDDGVAGVVVFFEAERLPVERTSDLFAVAHEPHELGFALAVV